MNDDDDLLEIVQAALGTFDNRQSYTPGMFEPLKPLFHRLGYEGVAIYIADDYPDRMQLVSGYGGEDLFPNFIALNNGSSLFDELSASMAGVKGAMLECLFSHGRELGALVVVSPDAGKRKVRDAFRTLAKSVSIMAYVERIRTNGRREREERDIFFSQSLTNRLLVREAPRVKGLRLGFEFIRSLDAGGDFFDFIPTRDGGLLGFVGCCSGKGLRTVLEVCQIMRITHRALHSEETLSDVVEEVNDLLVAEKHRAHQASLCLFRVDLKERKLHMAKAGRLGMLLCGPGTRINNVSAPGATFLGMVPHLAIKDEVYDFAPGQSLFCVTEGLYSSRNVMNVKPQLHWFLQAVETTLEVKHKIPLANAIFKSLDAAADLNTRPTESMLAVSVEFTGK